MRLKNLVIMSSGIVYVLTVAGAKNIDGLMSIKP